MTLSVGFLDLNLPGEISENFLRKLTTEVPLKDSWNDGMRGSGKRLWQRRTCSKFALRSDNQEATGQTLQVGGCFHLNWYRLLRSCFCMKAFQSREVAWKSHAALLQGCAIIELRAFWAPASFLTYFIPFSSHNNCSR